MASNRMLSALDTAHTLVLFIGNPRSGTTLVAALLNTHPATLIANELDLLRALEAGIAFDAIAARLARRAADFAARPDWTGYDYGVDVEAPWAPAPIRVIGDKKAARTARAISADASLLPRLAACCAPLRLKLIHCVRHPLDCIATRALRSDITPADARLRYFEVEQMTLAAAHREPFAADGSDLHRIYLEQLIAEPRGALTGLLGFLGLSPPPGWLEACCRRIAHEPSRSRTRVQWPAGLLEQVRRDMDALAHLHRYADDLDIRPR